MTGAIVTPDRPENLPDEFQNPIVLDRFHRYAIAADENGPTVVFGLLGKDGSHHYYQADIEAIRGMALNIGGLAEASDNIANGLGLTSKIIPFDTVMANVAVMSGGGADGHLQFFFSTPGMTQLSTIIGPQLAASLVSSLQSALSKLPTPPTIPPQMLRDGNVPGDGHSGKTAVTYFGQNYRSDILEAFGVLMVRANLMDRSLIRVFSAISGMHILRAEAAYYSTLAFKARCDLIRSLVPFAPIDDKLKKDIFDTLDKASSVAGRRNDLVHANWSFEKDRFTAATYAPNKKQKRTNLAVSAKFILEIASTYRSVGEKLELHAGVAMTQIANIAQSAADAPPSI